MTSRANGSDAYLLDEPSPEHLERLVSSANSLWTHPVREFDVFVFQLVVSSSASHLNAFLNSFPSLRPNWEACDICRRTALHHAVARNDHELVTALLAKGANPFIKDNLGQTPLHVAWRLRFMETAATILDHVTMLWSNGIEARHHLVNIKDNKGRICSGVDEDSPNYQAFSSAVSTTSSVSSLSVSVDELDADVDAIDRDGHIGRGSEGEVQKGRWRGTTVALKMDSPENTDTRFRNEIEILLRLRHPNLVLMMGLNVKHRFIVLEYCSGGNLFDLLHRKGLIDLSWRQRLKILMDIARAMNYLHTLPEKVIHRDLKSLNVLLGEEIVDEYDTPTAKVTDFGLSFRSSDAKCAMDNAIVGTYQWMAPEVLSRADQDERVDTYSYGIVMFEVVSRSVPFADTRYTNDELRRAVIEGFRPNLELVDRSCPLSIVEIMKRSWSACRDDRPRFDDILRLLDATVLRRTG